MSLPAEVATWGAVFALCLLILRQRWGAWLLLPAVLLFVAWPALRLFAPLLPIWQLVLVVVLAPVFAVLFTVRGAMAIARALYGSDVASRLTTRWLLLLGGFVFGGLGRGRDRPAPAPVLPRPGAVPFNPQRHGDGG